MTTMARCRLCRKYYPDSEMSDEHYPARSVGNNDIVAFDIVKFLDGSISKEIPTQIKQRMDLGENLSKIAGDIFDNELSTPLYPKGRTARTLCRRCNTFLGKYDEAYLKFFKVDGDPKTVHGFQKTTKIQIIKSIYAKFLSIPETEGVDFDFLDFLTDTATQEYKGRWRLYFVKRDFSSDLLGYPDIGTGKGDFDKGIVYELSDEKFIFNLMDFDKHSCFEMNDIWDLLKNDFTLIQGVGHDGGYHASIFMSRLFADAFKDEETEG